MDNNNIHKTILLSTIKLSGLMSLWAITSQVNTVALHKCNDVHARYLNLFGYWIDVPDTLLNISMLTTYVVIVSCAFELKNI